MKTAGWICTVLGALSFFGGATSGYIPLGPTVLLALGLFWLNKAESKNNDRDKPPT